LTEVLMSLSDVTAIPTKSSLSNFNIEWSDVNFTLNDSFLPFLVGLNWGLNSNDLSILQRL
jgi:hypothetical protein